VVTATIPQPTLKALASRLDKALPVGNEGAGVVIKAGANAQGLLGKTVAALGGGMYSQFRVLNVSNCLVLPADATPADGASCFVNPLTALGMVETMRREGHKALVHTAAASNLGQMLNKICLKDGIGLVNIVRSQEQVALLRGLGAVHVYDSTSSTFTEELTQALVETGATLAFDATGGGRLAGQILACMEVAANRTATTYSPYGSPIHKQVYIYGRLEPRPLELAGTFGMAWGVGGWLLMPFLEKIGPQAAQKLRDRVAAELKTTFASHYAAELSLTEVLQLDKIAVYSKRSTGKKYLINPNKGLR
jgi:NADPH:quinone reductase-like Zn-dependent oxidoreductase